MELLARAEQGPASASWSAPPEIDARTRHALVVIIAKTSIMRASIRDILVAIAFGTIVYPLGDEDETSPYGYRAQTHISPLQRLHRLRGLLSA